MNARLYLAIPLARCTSPNRSMIRWRAFLLFPILPRRKTISDIKSLSAQMWYACTDDSALGHISTYEAYRFQVIVIASAEEIYQPVRSIVGTKLDLKLSCIRLYPFIVMNQHIPEDRQSQTPDEGPSQITHRDTWRDSKVDFAAVELHALPTSCWNQVLQDLIRKTHWYRVCMINQ